VTDAWVYLLRCRDGSLYTGWTVDVPRRLARHQAGTASRYTASRRPVVLALALPMGDRTAARREEARIKRLTRAQKLALLAGVGEGDAIHPAWGPVSGVTPAPGRASSAPGPAPGRASSAPGPAPGRASGRERTRA
jgi:putative endonuclease